MQECAMRFQGGEGRCLGCTNIQTGCLLKQGDN